MFENQRSDSPVFRGLSYCALFASFSTGIFLLANDELEIF